MYLIGIDLGTTGCKCMVFDYNGRIMSQSYTEYGVIKECDSHIEQDAELWWRLARQMIAESVAASGVPSGDIKAIGVSSQGISFVPVDAYGNTLYRVISWLDTRPVEQTGKIHNIFGDSTIFNRTGKRISPIYTLPKIMWLKENMPDIYARTDKFLMGLDYITFKLTGKAITDYSMASGTMAFDITARKWDEEIIRQCGLDTCKMPEVGCAGRLAGYLDTKIADELGLHSGVKVILGAQDQKCASIGVGIKEGIAAVSLGTAAAVSSIISKPVFDRDIRVPCFCLDEKSWILESVINTCCISLKWLKNTLLENMSYAEMDKLAQKSIPGANGLSFYPHMEGATSPYWRSEMKGFLYGLSLSSSREDIVRSLLEGIGFQIKINIDVHEEITGRSINEIRIFGGGSRSELWCRLIADITGKTVSILYTSEVANLGAAILAGIGAGIYKDYEDALSRIDLVREKITPDKEENRRYNEITGRYIEIQKKLLA